MRFFGRPAAVVLATTAALALSSCDSTGDSVTGAAGVTTGALQPTGAGAAEVGEADGTGDVGDPGEAPGSDAPSGHADPAVQDAVTALGTLEVKGRAPKTGYSRDQFGQRWKDTDRNGCDQRNDVLARDMAEVRRDGPCTVLAGTLDDPYTATTITFVRGQDTSTAVHIDHIVAMSDAWQKGAQQLTPERREEFANDHLNLLAVDGPANMQKGDGDAATWLPSNRPFRCSYVATQVQVKAKYGLWVTAAERDAIARELEKCGADGIAPVDEVPPPAPEVEPEPAPAQPAVPVAPAGEPGGESAGEVYYANCAAARAAGAAPILRGQPGYRAQMDGDNDGVACE
ncbi:GmrSD restriction endonuclease domain-containing protein [Corynebacterium sp.]|uniref:GmrSD restriction endonuclease domain-containing protein n=1 Tax=Corynebacterium sp. TaxID=1720 RepID=UPI003B3B855D